MAQNFVIIRVRSQLAGAKSVWAAGWGRRSMCYKSANRGHYINRRRLSTGRRTRHLAAASAFQTESPVKLPNHLNAVIDETKLVGYLLSSVHPFGRHKAAFFRGFGFSANAPEVLARALLKHAAENEVARVEDSSFGRRYIVQGALTAPDGRTPMVRAVWFIESSEHVPRFITAYALKRA